MYRFFPTSQWIPAFAGMTLFLILFLAPAHAQQRSLNIIRDAETENWLRELAAPVFEQAGIPKDRINLVLVQSPEINAFVAGGMNIFIYTGLLKVSKSPDEVLGVLAHETGHISGGHLVRTQEEMRNASATAILATIAGIAAAAASKDGGAGAAAISLGQEVAARNFLSYSRTQESAADQAALRYLDGAGLSADGMYNFLRRLQDQELLPTDQQSEFVRTHPLTRERVESVRAHIDANPGRAPLPQRATEQYQRIMAKLNGYLDPRGTLQRIGPEATSFTDRYARAVALHLTGDMTGALAQMDVLLQLEPNNPYLHEFRGQVLYESGKSADAVAPYRKAVSLSNGNALLRLGLAQALLDTGADKELQEAVDQLEAALTAERKSPLLWRLLATAYGRQNQLGMAAYALSEEAAARGDKAIALQQAKRAQELLPQGSPGWLRAGDVLANNEKKED
jgi:predicted Zn-dependent protease